MRGEMLLHGLLEGPGAYALAFVLGALFGSFANVCIYRWPPSDEHPNGRSVVTPGSHCFACGASIPWFDNLPLVSFLWLRGRCRSCGEGFSSRYLGVEFLCALLFTAVYHHAISSGGEPAERLVLFGTLAAFVFIAVVVSFIDIDHKLILNRISYPGIPVFYGLSLLIGAPWERGLIGAAVGYGIVRAVSDGYFYLTGRMGLGYGDGKLLAMVGALLGWQAALFAIFAGSVLGSVFGIVGVLIQQARGQVDGEPNAIRHAQIPFGPYLATAGVLFIFAEPWLRSVFPGVWRP